MKLKQHLSSLEGKSGRSTNKNQRNDVWIHHHSGQRSTPLADKQTLQRLKEQNREPRNKPSHIRLTGS